MTINELLNDLGQCELTLVRLKQQLKFYNRIKNDLIFQLEQNQNTNNDDIHTQNNSSKVDEQS